MLRDDYWLAVKDGNPIAFDLFTRHYSYDPYADGRRERYGYRNRHLIVGPGEKLVLVGKDGRALFCWRRFRDASGQAGACCTAFRNESEMQGADLILEAELLALRRWPDESRFYTFVDPRKVRGNPPGGVFVRAGWRQVGITKWNKLLTLAKVVTPVERSAATLMLEAA